MISPEAVACPKCGQPVQRKKRTSKLTIALAALFAFGVLGSMMARPPIGSTPDTSPTSVAATTTPAESSKSKNPERDAQLQLAGAGALSLKRASKDPESFEMKSVMIMPNGVACYEYRAKNSFNAMLAGSAVLTPKKKLLIQEHDGNSFVAAWNKDCTKPGGDELLPLLKTLDIL